MFFAIDFMVFPINLGDFTDETIVYYIFLKFLNFRFLLEDNLFLCKNYFEKSAYIVIIYLYNNTQDKNN